MSVFAMSKVVLKALVRPPATHNYPAVPRQHIPGSRGELMIEIEKCTFCILCEKRCPTAALKVDRPGKVWTIDRLACISCNYCVEACPKKCLALSTNHGVPTVTKDKESHRPAPKPAAPPAVATATVNAIPAAPAAPPA